MDPNFDSFLKESSTIRLILVWFLHSGHHRRSTTAKLEQRYGASQSHDLGLRRAPFVSHRRQRAYLLQSQ